MKVEAILAYEQWGWSLTASAWEQLATMYPDAVLIWDRVDSADFFQRTKPAVPGFKALVQVLSLSKLLGLAGGGMLLAGSELVEFRPDPVSAVTELLLRTPEIEETLDYREYFKNQGQVLHPAVTRWLEENSVIGALREEGQDRQQNLRAICDSSLASGWPLWMAKAAEGGAAPGIAPILRGTERDKLVQVISALAVAGIRATIYHFNWSGNPLDPGYEPCLAFPLHGMVPGINELVKTIERTL